MQAGKTMAKSKKDLSRMKGNLKAKIADLEEKCAKDPLKRNPKIHQELEKLKKKMK